MIDLRYHVDLIVRADPSAQTPTVPNSSLDHVLDCAVEALRDAMLLGTAESQTIINDVQSDGCAASGRYVLQVQRAPNENADAMFSQLDAIISLPDE